MLWALEFASVDGGKDVVMPLHAGWLYLHGLFERTWEGPHGRVTWMPKHRISQICAAQSGTVGVKPFWGLHFLPWIIGVFRCPLERLGRKRDGWVPLV